MQGPFDVLTTFPVQREMGPQRQAGHSERDADLNVTAGDKAQSSAIRTSSI